MREILWFRDIWASNRRMWREVTWRKMVLSLKLFGAFRVQDESGANLVLPTRKTRALLAYLAFMPDTPHPRERLMALLWGDRGERQARQSLNNSLASIRRLGGGNDPSMVDSDGEYVTIHGSAIDTDVHRFQAIRDIDPAAAAALYDGPFLDGLAIAAPAFEEWLNATRSALEAEFADTLQRTAEAAEAKSDIEQAMWSMRRLIALDPLREDAHRLLMRYMYETGDRVGALRQYQVCADILEKELRVSPDTATQAIFEMIRQDASVPEQRSKASRENGDPPAQATSSRTSKTTRQRMVTIFAPLAAIVIAGTIIWLAPWNRSPAPPPGKPSIAVLPFENLSADPTQDYFSDGITEDIITRLARRSDMRVIARMSSFLYRDKSVKAQTVGRNLGVRYLLEGSVQRSADNIRITAQLIEAETGNHLWAQSYDRNFRDIFAIQDEIAGKVAVELAVNLTEGAMARLDFQATDNVEAYDYFLRGVKAFQQGRKRSNMEAGQYFEQAIKLDPKFARAVAWLGMVRYLQRLVLWTDDPDGTLAEMEHLARRAIAIDANSAYGYAVLSKVHLFRRKYDEAMAAGRRAIAIEPANAALYAMSARTSMTAGRLKEATTLVNEMLRLAPRPPIPVLSIESWVHYLSGRYAEAITACQRLLERSKSTGSSAACYRRMIGSYMALGREAEAQAIARTHMTLKPNFSLKRRAKVLKRRPFKDLSWIDTHIERLRRAGLPD